MPSAPILQQIAYFARRSRKPPAIRREHGAAAAGSATGDPARVGADAVMDSGFQWHARCGRSTSMQDVVSVARQCLPGRAPGRRERSSRGRATARDRAERRGAGECACNGDEGRWGHEGGAPCDTGNRAGAAPNVGCKSGHCGQPAKAGRSDQSDFAAVSGRLVRGERRDRTGRGDTRQMSGWRGMMREPCRCARRCAVRRRRAAMPVRAGPAPRASSDPCGADSRHPS